MNWASVKLADLATVSSGGGAPQDADAFSTEGVPFVRAGSLVKLLEGHSEQSLELLQPDVAADYKLKLFPAGTVLFAKSGMSATKGHIYQLQQPAYVVNHLAALIPRSEIAGRYLRHVLKFKPPTCLIKDEAYPSIRLGDIEDMEVPSPKTEAEQKRIAAILDQADALRRKRQHALTRLSQLGQAIFYEMFGDPTAPTVQDLRPLGECMRLINGRAYRKEEERDAGTPVLRIQNLNGGNRWFFSDLQLPSDKYCVDGDLLFAWSATFGPYIWHGPRVIYHYHIWKIEPVEGVCEKLYAYQLLSLLSNSVKAGGRGISMTHATKSGMEERLIPMPPFERQLTFKNRLLEVQKSLSEYRAYVSKAEDLFSSLQHRAFRGEL